jgi:hypothetical protein
MKKFSFFLMMLATVSLVQAQTYEEIKQNILLNQYKKAKEDVDKRMTNAKFASKAEAFILKAAIYAALAGDSATSLTPEGPALQAGAEDAFKKYMEMEPSLELLKDPVYKNGPLYIYSNLFSSAYKDYQAKNWGESFAKFEKVMAISDILSAQKMLNSAVDTNAIILAAFTAENNKDRDNAAKYYKRLADIKAGGDAFESVYRFLTTYSFEKKDMDGFEKYRALGKSMYPKSDFFTYDKNDFAVGLVDNFTDKMKALDEVLVKEPGNYKTNLLIGQLIYDTLYSDKEGAVKPANAAELEAKMVAAFRKASETEPDNVIPNLFLGDHFMNKSILLSEQKDKHAEEMKKRTKPGAQPSKDDVAKKAELAKQYDEAYYSAVEPYEKAGAIYAKKGLANLSGSEKQQYKKAAGYLGDIYVYKTDMAKGKPADAAKFTAEARKWNDLYAAIR